MAKDSLTVEGLEDAGKLVPEGTYEARLTEVRLQPYGDEDPQQTAVIIDMTISEEGCDFQGERMSKFFGESRGARRFLLQTLSSMDIEVDGNDILWQSKQNNIFLIDVTHFDRDDGSTDAGIKKIRPLT